MLNSKNLNDKTYEEVISEAVSQIPLYTKEWTNYNPSDPGITILENLSAFQVLQQSEMNQVPDSVKEKLLQMVGIKRQAGVSAGLLLEAQEDYGGLIFPAGQKFMTEDICFELEDETQLSAGKICGIFSETEGILKDITALSQPYGIPGGSRVFGDDPKEGDCIYFVLSSLMEAGRVLVFYMNIPQEYDRNPFDRKDENLFAQMSWELLTEKGYQRIEAEDETFCLMCEGTIRLQTGQTEGIRGELAGREGYIIRAVLKKAEYDIAPCVESIHGFLLQAVQRDTKSTLLRFRGAARIQVCDAMADTPYFFVYAKESQDGMYYEYQEDRGEGRPGRSYRKKQLDHGRYELTFSREMYQYAPLENLEDGIAILCCTEEVMLHRKLGQVCGYDEQQIELAPFKGISKESFRLLVARQDSQGNQGVVFLEPDIREEGGFCYTVDGENATLTIHDCGEYEGMPLMIGSCALCLGKEGNILSGNEFVTRSGGKEYRFLNIYTNRQGRYGETIQEMRRRFVKSLSEPASIVTAKDCETLIQDIPGLAIHRVRADVDFRKNIVNVAVKPCSREPFPHLSEIYLNKIRRCIENNRMLTVRMNILQPVYLPVHVQATIYIKKHFENCRDKIEQVLRDRLDYLSAGKNFGDLLSFHEVYHAVEVMECVEEIYELSLRPGSMQYALRVGMDFKLRENCLCYPGKLELNLSAKIHG